MIAGLSVGAWSLVIASFAVGLVVEVVVYLRWRRGKAAGGGPDAAGAGPEPERPSRPSRPRDPERPPA